MKYILDTNLYINAFRNETDARALERFYSSFVPHVYLSSVVLHELTAGAGSKEKAQEIHRHVARPFERANRVATPGHRTWRDAGVALAEMARAGEIELRRVPKSFVNDVMLACSCREIGAMVIGDNRRDYERIQRFVSFEFASPWPS